MLKLPGDWDGCPNKLSRKRNKSSENSVCVWITHKKLSHFIRQIFLIKNSIFYENLLIPCFRSCKGFYLIWSISKILKFEMFLWNYEISLFPCFGNLMALCLTRTMSEPHWHIFVFPSFSRTVGIHSSHLLGIIVWISASHKVFKKAITFECLSLFMLFPCFWNK